MNIDPNSAGESNWITSPNRQTRPGRQAADGDAAGIGRSVVLPELPELPSRPLRVLLMIASLEGGGSERQTLLLLRWLDRRRFAPELYLMRCAGGLLDRVPADVPIHVFAESDEARASGRWNWPGRIHRSQVRHLAALLQRRRIDVIYDRTFHMSLVAHPAAAQRQVPRVATIVSPPSQMVPLRAGRFRRLKRRRLRQAYSDAALVLAVGGPVAADAARYYGLPRRRFLAVPNPIDSQALDAAVAAAPRPPRDASFHIVCVGRMSVEKGQSELIDALGVLRRDTPDFPPAKLWLIGDGPLRRSLQQHAASCGVAEQVEFLGQLSEPAPWIAAADVLCLPSRFEGFPNVLLEAFALGVPVVARRIDVIRWLGRLPRDPTLRGRDYVATFPDRGRQRGVDLAAKLRRLWLHPTATASRVAAARRLARETLAIGEIVPRIESLLAKAALHQLGKPGRHDNL